MNKQTYSFHETGVIPGIPGEFHAGLLVDVDVDSMTVLGARLMQAPDIETIPAPSDGESTIEQAPEEGI